MIAPSEIVAFLKETYHLNRSLVGTGMDEFFAILKKYIDIEVHEFPPDKLIHTWKMPDSWRMREGRITDQRGNVLISTDRYPLCVWTGSQAIKTKISKKDLFERHLAWSDRKDDAIPYLPVYYRDDWGFSIPKSILEQFQDDVYDILIEADQPPCSLKVAQHVLPGKSAKSILLASHVDHPFQLADGLSGVAGLLAIRDRLASRKNLFTYKFLFVPETIGSLAFSTLPNALDDVCYTIFVDGISADAALHVQKTLYGTTVLDRTAVAFAGSWSGKETIKVTEYRQIPGNDEAVFNGPGIGIPSLLIQRWPMPNYHTHLDNFDGFMDDKFWEAVNFITEFLSIFEKSVGVLNNYTGILSLSSYGLWDKYGNGPERRKFEVATSLMDGKHSLVEIEEYSNFSRRGLEELITILDEKSLVVACR